MTDSRPDERSPSSDELYEKLEPFEPYTTDELAAELQTEENTIRKLLNKLTRERKIRKKTPKESRTIWIREPPKNSCPSCEYEFEIKFLHPVFSSVQYCPRCGAHLK